MTEREKLRKGLPFSQTAEKKQRFSRLFMPITASIVSVVAIGNPCHVLREITEQDSIYMVT